MKRPIIHQPILSKGSPTFSLFAAAVDYPGSTLRAAAAAEIVTEYSDDQNTLLTVPIVEGSLSGQITFHESIT